MKAIFSIAILAITTSVVFVDSVSTSSPIFLSESDKTRLRGVVKLSEPLSSNDPSSIYYYVNVLAHLDKSVPDSAKICSHIQSLPAKDLESIFFITGISKLISSCSLDASKYLATIQEAANPQSTVAELHKSVLALSNLGKAVDSARYSKLLLAAIKKEDTLLNHGLALQIASKFSSATERNTFAGKISAILGQADEVDERSLQFEGGLGVSAAIIQGAYQLSEAINKAPTLTTDQVTKFVYYFNSRKVVLSQKGASDVVETLSLFTTNKFHIPYTVSTYGSSALSVENPILTLKITNVLGQSVAPITVTGATLTKNGQDNPTLSKIAFKPVTGDSTLYAHDFFEKPLPAGLYKLIVDVTLGKADSRVFRNTKIEVPVSILSVVQITDAEFGNSDSDSSADVQKLSYPSSLYINSKKEKSDRFVLKFKLQDQASKTPFDAHQTFVRFYNEKTNQEIIYVADKDSLNYYKVDLNFEVRSKDFGGISGIYQFSLIVGDPLMMNSIEWNIGSIDLQLDGPPSTDKDQEKAFGLKKEIKHIFREPEKRPHSLISTFFTFLVMVPALVLFVLWFKIGINLSSFRFTISSLLFHLSLAVIFLLYGCFFVSLNMFQTVKYLFGFGLIAYFSGHSLLASRIKQQNSPVNKQQ